MNPHEIAPASATAAAQIVQRLQNEPEALTWRRALVSTAPHLYILVFEGETRPLLCAGGAAMTSALEGLHNSAGAAVFDVGPPIGRAMEALRGLKSAEGSVVPGLEEARPEASRHQADSLPPRPVIAGEYRNANITRAVRQSSKMPKQKQLWAKRGKIFRSESLAG